MGLGMIHDFIKSQGYDFEVDSINGKWQKASDKSGHKMWYIGTDHGNGLLTFTFGDFREPDKRFTYCSKAALDQADEAKLKKFEEKVKHDKSLKQEISKSVVQRLWKDWSLIDLVGENADYLIRKEIPRPPGVIVKHSTEDNQKILIVPMRDTDGVLWNIQTVYAGGDKPYHPGARAIGCFYTFGSTPTTPILIGEGFATCAAAHLASGLTVVCAFSGSNLEPAIRSLLEKGVSSANIVLLADWDGETFKRTGKNPGMLSAQKLTEKYRIGWVSACDPKDMVERNEDFADLWLKPHGRELTKEIISSCVLFYQDLEPFVFSVPKPKKAPVETEGLLSGEELDSKSDSGGSTPSEPASHPFENQIDKLIEFQRTLGSDKILVPPVEVTSPKLEVKRLGAPWSPRKHNIVTRNSGFHRTELTRGQGVKLIPEPNDLRLAFEEKNPFVTHRESEVVYAFTGKKYEAVMELDMASFADANFDPKPSNHTVREFIGAVTRFNVRGDEFFDTAKRINFQNGWLDLRTMEFRPHTASLGFKSVLAYDFDEHATCPEFEAFLGRILGDDKVLENMVMEFLGYVLSGDECWTAKALVLKGEGSNGKSTFLKVVRALIGKPNVLAAKIGDFKSEYVRQQLDGKLACISEETPKEALLDSSHFKDIVAGGTISVRAIYGTPYNLDVHAKLIFSCNDMPPSADTSPALLRRLLIVPFNAIFTEQTADPFIAEKLLSELPGIFVKAIQAYIALQKRRRFEQSERVNDELLAYKKASNPVMSYIEDRVLVHPVDGTMSEVISSMSALYSEYVLYCKASGFFPMNVINFSKSLSRAMPDSEQRRGMFGKKDDRFRGLRAVTDRRGKPFLDAERIGLGV